MSKIVLTPQELEDLKDEIKFREKVVLELKSLNGIPKKVWTLGVFSGIHTTVIIGVILCVVGMAFKVLAK